MRLLVLWFVSACTTGLGPDLATGPDGADATAAVDAKLGASHGVEEEQLEYEFKLAGIFVGRFQVAVGRRGVVDGRAAVIVKSRGTPAGAASFLGDWFWDLTTTIDIASGFAIAQSEQLVLDGKIKSQTTHTWSIAERQHNTHSAAGALRGWRSAPGARDTSRVTLVDTEFAVEIADAARETITTPFGTRSSARYEGLLRGKHRFTVWVSDDVARVPLRLHWDSRIGAIDVELVSYDVARDP